MISDKRGRTASWKMGHSIRVIMVLNQLSSVLPGSLVPKSMASSQFITHLHLLRYLILLKLVSLAVADAPLF